MHPSLLTVVWLLGIASGLAAQDQSALADSLLQGDIEARIRAVTATERIPAGDVSPQLRDALRSNLRWWVDRPRPFTGGSEWEGEAYAFSVAAVARLEDPATIPELILSINTGNRVANALAAMKPESYPQVIAVIESSDAAPGQVVGALLTLSKMASGELGEPLSTDEEARVAQGCLDLLEAEQDFGVLLALPRTIVAISDRRLLERFRAIVGDPSALQRLGVPREHIEDYRRVVRLAGIGPQSAQGLPN